MSWLISLILGILLIVLISILLMFQYDIKRMTKQLEEISENFGTNELVRTNTHNQSLSQFVEKINQLISMFKQNQREIENRELELKQEITNISHDLRTPLTSIQGFLELLADPNLSDAEKKEYITIIQKKIDHIKMVVDLFYELSQIDSSDKKFHMEKQFLDQIVVENTLLFYDDFENKQLQVEIVENPIPPILADKKAVARIVTNIIQNALTYAKTYVKISFKEEQEYIWFQVINDIDGINGKDLEQIFNRTFRLDPSRAGSHLGLGLHIVQQLVNKQGGKAVAEIIDKEFIIKVSFKKWD